MSATTATAPATTKGETLKKTDRDGDVRLSNIKAATSIASVMRTSLGPKGMDKLLETGKGEILITNDGATILKNLSVLHPTANLLIQTSKAQDVEAGDGTTSVVVLAGALLAKAEQLLSQGIHPTQISDGFAVALQKALNIVTKCSKQVSVEDEQSLLECVKTSLASKIINQNASEIAPMAVDAVKRVANKSVTGSVDLKDIRLIKKLGGTIDDTILFDGLVLGDRRPIQSAGGPTKIVDPKIALIQFSLASPKTDIENNIAVSDYSQIDRILKEERKHVLELVKKIAASGANVVLIQKSIVRDSVNDIALHFLAKKKILAVKDIERTDVEFICKTVGCIPVAHIDQLTVDKLGSGKVAQETELVDGSRVFTISVNQCPTATILIRGSSELVLSEAERSIHDALCVVNCIFKNPGIVPGGGATEIEILRQLEEHSHENQSGVLSIIIRAFAEAMEIIPATLAENCGVNAIRTVTELRTKHRAGLKLSGISGKKGVIVDDMIEGKVVQPALVTISALKLATEVTRMILKIDDILQSR